MGGTRASTIWMVGFVVLLLDQSVTRSELLDEDKQHLQKFLEETLPSRSGYDFSVSPCSWKGVVCVGQDTQKRVGRLLLEGLGLQGHFPVDTLGRLSALTQLSLFNNSLTGDVFSEVSKLTNLFYLSLSMNKFSGAVNAEIARLLQLRRLDLSDNSLNGPIPVEIGQLKNILYLYMSSNAFTGNIPVELCYCSHLVILDLASNRLSGQIPLGFGKLFNLVLLNLSRNTLEGDLPPDLSQMLHLSVLDLSSNRFTGHIPQAKNLKFINLRNNLLAGSFDAEVFPAIVTLSSLEILEISSNKLTGRPSGNFSLLPALRNLSLAENNFSPGQFPVIDSLQHLVYLNLSAIHLTGAIPKNLGQLMNLTVLDLSNNNLNGSIPISLGSLHKLTHLDLSSNNLSGEISYLSNFSSLQSLNLSYNDAIGCPPPDLVKKFGSDSFPEQCKPIAAEVYLNQSRKRRSRLSVAVLIAIVLSSAVALCAILAAVILCRNKAKWIVSKVSFKEEKFVSGPFSFETDSGLWVANVKDPSSVPVVMFEKPLLNLSFADLLQATSNFNKEAQLTEGGFGPVYRAVLQGGVHVAIKVLIEGRVLTDQEAAAEFGVLSKVKHPNLVRLLGYCIVGDERLVIYEYMDNGGLHRWLHEQPIATHLVEWSRDTWVPSEGEGSPLDETMDWPRRHRIATGVARALAFLHHGYSSQLVHRDVKASNVLLDSDFEPHLANTGLAGVLAGNDDALFAGGTPGYAPPEYGQPSGKVSARGDVYSYGVVLLELVTGKRPAGDFYEEGYTGNLVGWVRMLMKVKKGFRALDPRLTRAGPAGELLDALRIGYLCTADAPDKRPTMQQVVGLLKDMETGVNSP